MSLSQRPSKRSDVERDRLNEFLDEGEVPLTLIFVNSMQWKKGTIRIAYSLGSPRSETPLHDILYPLQHECSTNTECQGDWPRETVMRVDRLPHHGAPREVNASRFAGAFIWPAFCQGADRTTSDPTGKAEIEACGRATGSRVLQLQ